MHNYFPSGIELFSNIAPFFMVTVNQADNVDAIFNRCTQVIYIEFSLLYKGSRLGLHNIRSNRYGPLILVLRNEQRSEYSIVHT